MTEILAVVGLFVFNIGYGVAGGAIGSTGPFQLMIVAIAAFVEMVLIALGCHSCLSSPPRHGAKVLAWVCLGLATCTVLGILASSFGVASVLGRHGAVAPPQVLSMLLLTRVSYTGAFILVLFLVRALAFCVGDQALASRTTGVFVLILVVVVVNVLVAMFLICMGATGILIGVTDPARDPGLLVGLGKAREVVTWILTLIVAVRYAAIVQKLRKSIDTYLLTLPAPAVEGSGSG